MRNFLLTLLFFMSSVVVFSQQMESVTVKGKPDGKFEQSYGTIKITGEVLNEQKTGTWIETHPNTELPHFIVQYADGKKNGLFLEIDKQANLIKKIDYKDGYIHGSSYQWFKGGRLSKNQEYKEGKLDGKTVICYDRGAIQEESYYKNGKRDGVTIWYSYADKGPGPKAAMYTYKDGVFEGVQETYYDDGSLKSTKMFSNNVANGTAVEFYEDGSIKSECTYKNGEVSGRVKEYSKGEKQSK